MMQENCYNMIFDVNIIQIIGDIMKDVLLFSTGLYNNNELDKPVK